MGLSWWSDRVALVDFNGYFLVLVIIVGEAMFVLCCTMMLSGGSCREVALVEKLPSFRSTLYI